MIDTAKHHNQKLIEVLHTVCELKESSKGVVRVLLVTLAVDIDHDTGFVNANLTPS